NSGLQIPERGRQFLLEEGTDQRYGARHLKRAIERHVVCPLARLMATDQIQPGDMLLIDRHPGEKGLAFLKEKEQRPPHPPIPFVAPIPSILEETVNLQAAA